MANKNPVKQVAIPGDNTVYDFQDNTLEPGKAIIITTSTTEGSKNTRTIAASFGTTSTSICKGNDYRLSNTRTPTSHADLLASTYGGGTTTEYGHIHIKPGDIDDGSTYKIGIAAGKSHTHSGYQLKLNYHHHSVHLYSQTIGEIFIDWWTTKSTAYTVQSTFLSDLFKYVKTGTGTSGGTIGLNGSKRSYIRTHGYVRSGNHQYEITSISGYTDTGTSAPGDKLMFYYTGYQGRIVFDIGSQSFGDFSDIIIN